MKHYRIITAFFLIIAIHSQAQNKNCSNNDSKINLNKIESSNLVISFIRSTDENIFLLDSILETYYLKDTDSMLFFNDYYDYDDNGNITEWIHRSTCNNCAAGGNYKQEYYYDEDENCIIEFSYDLDLIKSQWVLEYKLEQNFSANGNLLSYVLRLPQNNPDELINYSKVEYNYNSNNEITNKVEYTWSKSLNEWSFSARWEWEFNNIGQLEKKELFRYDLITESWTPINKTEYFYDTRGYDSVQIQANWNKEKEIWNNYTKYEHYYDSVGNETTISIFKKDTTEPWIGYNKITNAFDEKGNKVSSEECHWSSEDSNWSYFRRTEWDFNYNNQLVTEISFRWDNIQNKYNYSSKIVYDYNLYDQITLQLNSVWDSSFNDWIERTQITYEYNIYKNLKTKNIYDRTNDEVWQLRNNVEYFYSEFKTSINSNLPELQSIKLYPNPAKETFTIEPHNPESTFGQLFNSTGSIIKTLSIENGVNTYNISGLKRGIYFIQIPQQKGTIVKKLVKN